MSSSVTMRSWVKQVNGVDEVPETFQEIAKDKINSSVYVLYVPRQGSLTVNDREALVIMSDSGIFVAENAEGNLTTIDHPFDGIDYLEYGAILLKSWVKVFSEHGMSDVQFNSVSYDLVKPLIDKVRTLSKKSKSVAKDASFDAQLQKFGAIDRNDLKFKSYCEEGLMAGDIVRQFAYQGPSLYARKEFLGVDLLTSFVAPHAAIVTDDELILMDEEVVFKRTNRPTYGMVFKYIALDKLEGIQLEKLENNFESVVVRLRHGGSISRCISSENNDYKTLVESF